MSTRRAFLVQSVVGLTAAASIQIDKAAAGTEEFGDPEKPHENKGIAPADPAKRLTLNVGAPLLRDVIWYYSNWSASDELSDNVELTEELAMRQLIELARLRKLGVRLDYYLMDAFWYAPDGAYRTWRKPHWPNGPDRWIAACKEIGAKPGLWFASNCFGRVLKHELAPRWRSSLSELKLGTSEFMSFSEGAFLSDLMSVFQLWYDRGIRMFKLDFANFDAAGPKARKDETKAEIAERNKAALRNALKAFRQRNPEAVFIAYNGFMDFPGEPKITGNYADYLQQGAIDLRWLEVFESLYSADARPADVPQVSFWRSIDVFSDQLVRIYEGKFVPLERIDSAGFMCGDTNTSFRRKTHAWRGMLILNAARGGG